MRNLSKNQGEQIKLVPFYFFYALIVLGSAHLHFFWDKDIFNSRQAFWFLENGFTILPPSGLDSGHPPLIGLMLAFLWKTIGKTLIVGHLAMIPFAIGLVWQLYLFLRYFVKPKSIYKALLLLMIDTSVMTQLVILTGDLLTLFFFFLSLNAILNRRYYLLLLAVAGLGITSARGMMSCLIIGLFHFYFIFSGEKTFRIYINKVAAIIPYYLPAFLLIVGYNGFHYIKTGWIGYDPNNSNWAPCFELVDLKGFLRNIFIIVWRLVDFGRLFLWMAGTYFTFLLLKKKIQIDRKIKILIALLIISIMVYSPPMLIYKVINGHRYILPVYILVATLICYILFEKINRPKLVNTIYILLIAGLLSGNFWVYPDGIATGWDSTLAHLPYYKLRKQMINYIEQQKIPFDKVLSDVPNISQIKYIELNDDERHFDQENMKVHKYVFYSNVFNNFTDEQLFELKNNWIPIQQYRLVLVHVDLYKNPDYIDTRNSTSSE